MKVAGPYILPEGFEVKFRFNSPSKLDQNDAVDVQNKAQALNNQ